MKPWRRDILTTLYIVFGAMTYFFTLWRTFNMMIQRTFQIINNLNVMTYFLTSRRTFWNFDYFLTLRHTFWRHDVLFHVIKYLFTLWRTFNMMIQRTFQIINNLNVMTYFLTSRRTFWNFDYFLTLRHTFWRHDVLFHVIKYLFTLWRTFWRCNNTVHVITYFLTSWSTFDVTTFF